MKIKFIALSVIALLMYACTVSYQFNGAAINYDLVKTISIQDFPDLADYAYPNLSATFSDALRTKFITQTRLKMTDTNPDLELEGEIIRYDIKGMAVREDAYASMTELSITVRVRYVNNQNPNDDIDGQNFTASQSFENTSDLDAVQEQLNQLMIDDLTDQIYNATLGNW